MKHQFVSKKLRRTHSNSSTSLVCLICITLLYGCGPQPTRPDRDTNPPSVQQAELLMQQGSFNEAASLYLEMSQNQPQQAEHWKIQAAAAYLLANRPGQTQSLLEQLNPILMKSQDQLLVNLLNIASSADTQRGYQVLQSLNYEARQLPEAFRLIYHRLRADAFLNTSQPYASALERLQLQTWLNKPEDLLENDQAILQALRQLSAYEASSLQNRHQPEEEIFGWLALIADLKQAVFSGEPAADAVALWASRFPGHPANRQSISDLVLEYELDFAKPNKIALLVPMRGRLAAAGKSIRDGLLTAHFESGSQGEINIFDSGTNEFDALIAYQQAIDNGATHIIGPLDKTSVSAIVEQTDGSIPILTLNYTETSLAIDELPKSGIYQFGLSPEDEARSVAEQMIRDGHTRAAALTAQGDWGQRIQNAFVEHYLGLGGQITQTSSYPSQLKDFSKLIPNLVGLNQSESRHRQLERLLETRLKFTAQKRHDLDAVFLAARSTQGKLIKPQFAFFNASDLKVYATSHIYSGQRQPESDRDLNGTRFCDAPYLLNTQAFQPDISQIRNWFPQSTQGSSARLFALGMDAYRLMPYLEWLRNDRGDSFPGATGNLSISANGQIRRQVDCAEFRRGVVEAIPTGNEDARNAENGQILGTGR